MLVHIVADYGHNDLAFAEVVQRLKLYLPEAEPVLTPVPAFSTLAAGFCVAQLGLNPAPEGMVIYHNVAPRTDSDGPRARNAGERLVYARLPNGTKVIGVNAGCAFSFLKEAALELHYVNVAAEGSQFRSRDLFPEALAKVVRGEQGALAEVLPPQDIPEVPQACIAYVDGYGNIKTTLRHSDMDIPAGSRIRILIGGHEQEATVAGGSFSVPSGGLAFSPGSSGWNGVRFMEVFLRSGSAAHRFGYPKIGEGLELLPLNTHA